MIFMYRYVKVLILCCTYKLLVNIAEIQINMLDEKLVKFLAMQRIQEIFASKDHPVSSASRLQPPPSSGHQAEGGFGVFFNWCDCCTDIKEFV